jgi:hypothetical protein
MQRIGDRNFLFAWQTIRAASQPGPEATIWHIGDATCRRDRHSITTPDHHIVLEICHIEQATTKGPWHFMVTSETWWDSHQRVLRSQLWAAYVGGSKEQAVAWLKREAATKDGLCNVIDKGANA